MSQGDAGGGEAAHQLLLTREQVAQGRAGGASLNAALNFRQLPLGLALLQRFDTTRGLFPGWLTDFFKQNLEEQAAVALLEDRGHFRGLKRLSRKAGNDQRRKNLFRFQAVVEPRILQVLRQLVAETLRISEHANQSPLDRLGRAGDELRLELQFAATLGGSLAKGGAQNRLLNSQLLRDARGPFGTQNAIGNFLNIGKQEIHRAALGFAGAQVHLVGTRDQVIHI